MQITEAASLSFKLTLTKSNLGCSRKGFKGTLSRSKWIKNKLNLSLNGTLLKYVVSIFVRLKNIFNYANRQLNFGFIDVKSGFSH